MHFTSFLDGKKLTIALTGEIDHHCAKVYIQSIAAKIEAYTPAVCVLDFRDVTFMDSSGIAVILRLYKRMQNLGGSMKVTHVPQQAQRVLKTAGISRIVTIEEGESRA